jgi:diguanylate cyclase (GGDEF)-like protein
LRAIDLKGAAATGERIRTILENLCVEHDGKVIPVSASVGCSSRAELQSPSPSALIALADKRLYRAKQEGRNRVVSQD